MAAATHGLGKKDTTREKKTEVEYRTRGHNFIAKALGGRPLTVQTLPELDSFATVEARRLAKSSCRFLRRAIRFVLIHDYQQIGWADGFKKSADANWPWHADKNLPIRASGFKAKIVTSALLAGLLSKLNSRSNPDLVWRADPCKHGADYLRGTELIGLRPCEWPNAIWTWLGPKDQKVFAVVVLNAKYSNDRAHGPYRTILCPGLIRSEIRLIQKLIILAAKNASSWKAFKSRMEVAIREAGKALHADNMDAMRSRAKIDRHYEIIEAKERRDERIFEDPWQLPAYVNECESTYAYWVDTINIAYRKAMRRTYGQRRRITLYTMRHRFIATLKRAGVSRVEIAALAGHISTKTAHHHYAHAHAGGAGGQKVFATKEDVERVNDNYTMRPTPPREAPTPPQVSGEEPSFG